jgi:multidrug transporter EmrE-like cation transporter
MLDKNLLSLAFIVCLIILSEAIAQSCVKKYNSENNILFLGIASIAYLCVILLLCKSYNYDGMYKINLFWSIGSIIAILLFDVFFFHAEVKKEDLIGITLCIIGLYFIFVHGH